MRALRFLLRLLAATALLAAAFPPRACEAQPRRTYTLNRDFDEGALVNVHHDIPDQLQLSSRVTLFPFINVAASARGTVVRIDVNTGAVVGEYKTAPRGRGADPSRTTVDFEGNVWVGNRAEAGTTGFRRGSVTKIGLVVGGTRCNRDGTPNPTGRYLKPPFSHCTAEDRDGDGLIKTSFGLLDTLSWLNPGGIDDSGGVASAEDECIILYKRVPPLAARHMSIDRYNNIWVGSISGGAWSSSYYQMTPDGEITDSIPNTCGGYGGLVDRNNVLWSTRGGSGLQRAGIDDTSRMCQMKYSYGITQDTRGNIWVTDYSGGRISKYQADGTLFPGFPKNCGCTSASGVAVTPADGNVWIACRGAGTIKRLDSSGTVLATITVGRSPTGVAVDLNGKVWSTNLQSNDVSRIDPSLPGGGAVDRTVPLGDRAGPYNYSDMTGRVANMFNATTGSWTVVRDGGVPGAHWGRFDWTDSIPAGGSITVDVRAADDRTALPRRGYTRVQKGSTLCTLVGRYLEIRTRFTRGTDPNGSPILYDLTVDTTGVPAADLISPRVRVIPCNRYPRTLTETSGLGPRRWSTGDTARSIVAQRPGTYSVTVWWQGSCPITDTITLGDGAAPDLAILRSGPALPCRYDSVLLRAVHSYGTIIWSTGRAGDSIVVTRPGVYAARLTDSLGCENADSIRVDFAPAPRVTIRTSGPSSRCEGDSIRLMLTPPFAAQRWSTGDTAASTVVTASGTYCVTVTDGNGCHADTCLTVTLQPGPRPAVSGPPTACTGSILQYAVTGLPGRAWTWTVDSGGTIVAGQSTSAIRVQWTSPGTRRVTVTETNTVTGCRGVAEIEVIVAAGLRPAVTAAPDTVACAGDSVTLDAGAYASYYWSNGRTTRRIVVLASGAFAVRVTDSAGCAGSSDTVRVAFNARPVPLLTGTPVVCAGASGRYRVAPAGAGAVAWFPDGGSITAAAGDSASVLWTQPGSRRLVVEISNGICTGRDTLLVDVRRAAVPLVAATPAPTACQGDTVRLTAAPGYARYAWSNGDSARATAVTAGGRYTVRVTDSAGCEAVSDTVAVAFRARPLPLIGGPAAICSGDSALLQTSSWAAYRWITPEGVVAGARGIIARRAGVYVVEVTDSNGCTGQSAPFALDVHGPPQPAVSGPSSFCAGDSILLEAPPGMRAYRWSLPGGDSAATRSIVAARGGVYIVSVTDSAGCSAVSPAFLVTELPPPPPPRISARCMALRATPAAAWQWMRNGADIPGATDSLYLAADTGSYRVRIRDANGCTALSDELRIDAPRAAAAVVRLPEREAAPGERVLVPVALENVSEPTLCGAGGFRAVIRLNASILVPAGATERGVLDGRDRLITIVRPWAPPGDPLAQLEFIAALGDTDRTPLHVESFAWDVPQATATAIDGAFTLRICREGGARLFEDSGRLALRPNSPNPFNAQTVIDYEILEAAPARLVVLDALGRAVAVLFEGMAEPGARRVVFDASDLPSGVYRLLLATPTGARSRSMVVVK